MEIKAETFIVHEVCSPIWSIFRRVRAKSGKGQRLAACSPPLLPLAVKGVCFILVLPLNFFFFFGRCYSLLFFLRSKIAFIEIH